MDSMLHTSYKTRYICYFYMYTQQLCSQRDTQTSPSKVKHSEVFSPAAKSCTSSTNSPYVTAGYAFSKNNLEKA